jgi:hypothetical protein
MKRGLRTTGSGATPRPHFVIAREKVFAMLSSFDGFPSSVLYTARAGRGRPSIRSAAVLAESGFQSRGKENVKREIRECRVYSGFIVLLWQQYFPRDSFEREIFL